MTTRLFVSALAIATIAASPVLAQGRGGGHGGGPPAGVGGAGMGRGPGVGTIDARGGISETGATMREQGRLNSRGPDFASPTGISHANQNSVLFGTTVAAGPLTGLTIGMNLFNSSNVQVGTVERIVTSNNGVIRTVLVRSSDGRRMFALSPRTLTLSGGVLTTTRL